MPEAQRSERRVIVVDDEQGVRELMREVLSERYVCVTAASAEEALELLGRELFHLVISDISMSRMDGIELLRRIKRAEPDCIVVMVSGGSSMESPIAALRAGAFDYIRKPFDLTHLLQTAERALEHYDRRERHRRQTLELSELVEMRTHELEDLLGTVDDVYRSTLMALATALETRDFETRGHSARVVKYSLALGRSMGLDADQLRSLEFGALLHDIGKIGVPDAVLRKPGKLTEEEWELMRQHTVHGERILRRIKFLDGAARVAAQHHERWDGKGYPAGLRGEDIDLHARIFAVADAFDAMTCDRIYRPARSFEEAAAEIERCSGTHFDPAVASAFSRVPREQWGELLAHRDDACEVSETHPALALPQLVRPFDSFPVGSLAGRAALQLQD